MGGAGEGDVRHRLHRACGSVVSGTVRSQAWAGAAAHSAGLVAWSRPACMELDKLSLRGSGRQAPCTGAVEVCSVHSAGCIQSVSATVRDRCVKHVGWRRSPVSAEEEGGTCVRTRCHTRRESSVEQDGLIDPVVH